MASSAQYVATPKIDNAITLTADASRTQPSNTTVGVAFTANGLGSRIDQINLTAVGATIASQVRLWVCKGDVGKTISSITSATTTATVTTATAHNLVTGDLITIQGSMPIEYNVKSVAVTVTSTTAFTFTIVSTGSVAAANVGTYASTRATASYSLLREVGVTAVTPSTTISAFNFTLCSQYNSEIMPIILPPAYSLRISVNDTQTASGINCTVFGGDF